MEIWINELWLLGTALIFTAVGWYWGVKTKSESVVAATIDSLVEQGYLKTRGTGEDMEILKHREWHND